MNQHKFIVLVILLVLAAGPAHAAIDVEQTSFVNIPVLDQGRVKPLITYAENYLTLMYGSGKLPGMSATAWLAEVLFAPEVAYDRPIFNISDVHIIDELEIERASAHLYSAHELEDGMKKHANLLREVAGVNESQRTHLQQEMAATYSRVRIYHDLAHSLSLLAPDLTVTSSGLSSRLNVPTNVPLSYRNLVEHRFALSALGADVLSNHKPKPADASEAVDILHNMEVISRDKKDEAFRIVPPSAYADSDRMLWLSLWELQQEGNTSLEAIKLSQQWQDLLVAYRSDDAAAFNQHADEINDKTLKMANDKYLLPHLEAETIYKKRQPLKLSLMFYVGGLFAALLSLYKFDRLFFKIGLVSITAGLGLHGIALIMRMYVMGRPPVTNLYASIIYVGFVVVLIGLIYEWRRRNTVGLFVASFGGAVLQYLGIQYDRDGDTMNVLVAVLDTNFWLATHVVCITTGYACCIFGAIIAHVYLCARMAKSQLFILHAGLSKNMRGIAYLALFFCALGTILGGIWADQSWGRFWGWDPKENGALLICLWLLMLTHGRISGRFQELGFAIGMALLNVVVSVSWFGVNLLGIGLHSYGFTQGAVTSLALFTSTEILFCIVSYVSIKRLTFMR